MTKKNVGGRPTKLKSFIKAAKKVLNKNQGAIIHTDEDLLFLINEELSDEDRIGESTFKAWKAEANGKGVEVITEDKKEMLVEFLALYKKALLEQRKELFNSLKEDKAAWQKWAWIIERKFDDWNIRHKHTDGDGKPLATQVLVKFIDDKNDRNTE